MISTARHAQSAASATIVVATFEVVGPVAAGYLFDRVFAPRAAIGIFVLSCAGWVGLLPISSPSAAFVSAALQGFGAGTKSDLLGYPIGR